MCNETTSTATCAPERLCPTNRGRRRRRRRRETGPGWATRSHRGSRAGSCSCQTHCAAASPGGRMGATRVSCTALNAATVESTRYWTSGVTVPDTYVQRFPTLTSSTTSTVSSSVRSEPLSASTGGNGVDHAAETGGVTWQRVHTTALIDVPIEVVTAQHPRSRGPDARFHQAVVRALLQTCASPLPVVKGARPSSLE